MSVREGSGLLTAYLSASQVIMATNRADTLDPALLRPGRLDRKIEFPHPDRRQKRLVFQVSPTAALSPSISCFSPSLASASAPASASASVPASAPAVAQDGPVPYSPAGMHQPHELEPRDRPGGLRRPPGQDLGRRHRSHLPGGRHAGTSLRSRPSCASAASRDQCFRSTQAVRKNRYVILPKDMEKAYKTVVRKSGNDFEFYN